MKYFLYFLALIIVLLAYGGLPFWFRAICNPKIVKSKEQVGNKYFYGLNDGTYVWTENNAEVEELVCMPKRKKSL